MAAPLSRSALRARDALVLQHLSLADAVASAVARRFFPLVEREDLIQVAREALLRSVLRCKAGEPAEPYLRRCISGALQHHLRDRVRLVRIPRRLHEQGQCPLGHISLDGHAAGEPCLLDQLASPEQEAAGPADDLALEQLVDQLPAAQATALRLTVLEELPAPRAVPTNPTRRVIWSFSGCYSRGRFRIDGTASEMKARRTSNCRTRASRWSS